MLRLTSFLALAALVSPAIAANYSATLAAQADSHIVAREINWACSGNTCQGTTGESRPSVLCQALAKRAGKIESFLVDGRALGAAELARCNSSAKGEVGKALAAQ